MKTATQRAKKTSFCTGQKNRHRRSDQQTFAFVRSIAGKVHRSLPPGIDLESRPFGVVGLLEALNGTIRTGVESLTRGFVSMKS